MVRNRRELSRSPVGRVSSEVSRWYAISRIRSLAHGTWVKNCSWRNVSLV